ncbi:MAG: hypothetical protein ACLQGP_05025 [Isosphaeraceae bacterium]
MNAHSTTNDGTITRAILAGLAATLSVAILLSTRAHGQAGGESLERPDGRRVEGRIEGSATAGFQFIPKVQGGDVGGAIALEPGSIIQHEGSAADTLAGAPPFHILVGETAQLSGTLRELTRDSLRLAVGWQSGEVALSRRCVQAIVQRPGEARVLADGFETLDTSRWSIAGKTELVNEPRLGERKSLRLGAEGASLVHNLEEPLASGRLELAFLDEGAIAAGSECVVESTFRGPAGPTAIRIILGWSEESLAVESPSGLQVQRLARTPGWHRLSLRFGPDQTEISVDGKELAHGRGPGGPLAKIKLATQSGLASPPKSMAAHFDDLQLIRFAEPPASLEVDISQDEARLVIGDQLYGEIQGADPRRVVMAVDGKLVSLPWGEVSGLYLRRIPTPGTPIEGLLVRAQWRSAPGDRPTDVDFAEGSLLAQSPSSLTLATPYSGTLTIPRNDLRRLVVLGRGRRLVIDTSAHHLGDEISVSPPLLDPPRPEGLALDRTVELAELPERPAELVLDVIGVISESGDSAFSQQVRNGELRTDVSINGRRFDYLNRHIKSTTNDVPERIRIPIPREVLHGGKNSMRIEVTGSGNPDSRRYDDVGILQIALEFPR